MDQSSGKLHPRKKQKLEHTLFDSDAETASDASTASTESEHGNSTSAEHDALNMARRPITPPLVTRAKEEVVSTTASGAVQGAVGYVPSPVRLTRIRDLPDAANVDTISLREILQDPLIKEQWQFNYLLDIDFIMSHLDEDVRTTVQTKIIHGSWKKEDSHRVGLEEAAKRWPNVQLIAAHMPVMFGTHHSKMMILIRHDDCAQVIIHTANMITQDWKNLSQAVWRSPLLPLTESTTDIQNAPIGSGERFRADLLRYLGAYEGRLRNLTKELQRYDFSSIRAALIASTPHEKQPEPEPALNTSWGWLGLKQILQTIPVTPSPASKPQINVQVSSIATLPVKWLESFYDVLGTRNGYKPLLPLSPKPNIRVIFPTADEVRRSLDGYAAGSSIHMKLQSAAQRVQLSYMKPQLYHWAGDTDNTPPGALNDVREAGRRRAAPHIKTYLRFSDATCTSLDWAMVTSANLSKQAWGEQTNKEGKTKISSYEIGVVIWPSLFAEQGEKVVMVPVFKRDDPQSAVERVDKVVGFRMPYDMPLVKYAQADLPWCAERKYDSPDWKGVVWGGYTNTV